MSFGRLERTPTATPMSDINMTPLIDVMLVLVVIFIITAPLFASSVPLLLPKAASAQRHEAPTFVVVSVQASGQIHWADQPVPLSQLKALLVKAAAHSMDTEVQLRADAQVPYGRIVEVMDMAQQAGLSRIGFVASRAP